MEFKERIKLLRRDAGMTQREVAEKIGVTYRTYQNYEAGASVPSGNVLTKLAKVFGISMDMLADKGDTKAQASATNSELSALLEEMQALFAGGKLHDEDKKYVIEALTEAFWRSKELSKRKNNG